MASTAFPPCCRQDKFDFHLGKEVDDIFGATIKFGMALLPAKALGFHDSNALQPDLL